MDTDARDAKGTKGPGGTRDTRFTRVKKADWLQLAIAIIGIFVLMFAVILFTQNVLRAVPQPFRAVLAILMHWVPAIVPVALMVKSRERLSDLGFAWDKVLAQVAAGLAIAAFMSLLLTIVPILAGLEEWVGQTSYTQPWQFLYEFAYRILGVAFAEELVFRGFLFNRLLWLRNSRNFAIIGSSVLFGLFHIFSGNPVQVVMTALIGLFLCLCREKIRNCTTLSLVIAHGVYDALIVLWCAVL